MAIQKIITVPNPVLRKKSKIVKKGQFGNLKKLIWDLRETLASTQKPEGMGISAPQIGVLQQVAVIKKGQTFKVLVDPRIISSSKQTLKEVLPEEKRMLEGCLSVPNVWAFVNRPAEIKIKYLDSAGKEKEASFEGALGICVQHEIDHLNGILFTQKALEQKEKFYRLEKDEKGKTVFTEIEI